MFAVLAGGLTVASPSAGAASWQAQYEALRTERDELLDELSRVDARIVAVGELFGSQAAGLASEVLADDRALLEGDVDVHNSEIVDLLSSDPVVAAFSADFPVDPVEPDSSSAVAGFVAEDGSVVGTPDVVVAGAEVSAEQGPLERPEVVVLPGVTGVSLGAAVLPPDFPFADLFNTYGSVYGLDPRLLAAFAMVESSFRPEIINCEVASSAGALGLMQFMPGTAQSYGIDPCIPEQAVDGAARYISYYYSRYGDWSKVMIAYNAGPGRVKDFEQSGTEALSQETRNYIVKVPEWWQRYQQLYPGFQMSSAAVCPLPGSSFSNDWGAPRSGGRSHQGTDMFSTFGAPVLAPVDGIVRMVDPVDEHTPGSEVDRPGIAIGIWSLSGDAWFFGHLDTVANVQVGDPVVKGQVLGTMGQTGNAKSSVPHLHIELRPQGSERVNPYPILKQLCN